MECLRKALVLAPLLIAGCVSTPVAPPTLPPPAYRPPPPPAPLVPNWENGILTQGNWSHAKEAGGGIALYANSASTVLSIRCDANTRRVLVSRPGHLAGRMTLRATTGARAYDTRLLEGSAPYVVAAVAPSDPQLDALAFSRGRFLVGVVGASDIVVPSGPEVARVVEDCRG